MSVSKDKTNGDGAELGEQYSDMLDANAEDAGENMQGRANNIEMSNESGCKYYIDMLNEGECDRM
jgi:hypothetical protein